MKKINTLLFFVFLLFSCTDEGKNNLKPHSQSSLTSKNNTDNSGESSISISPKDTTSFYHDITINNVYYNTVKIDSLNYGPHFICKTSSLEKHADWFINGIYSEKKEIFDFEMNKICELTVPRRKIEIHNDFYLARTIPYHSPYYFEFYNYRTQEAFLKSMTKFWTVEIPNTNIVSYLGYQNSENYSNSDSSNILGSLYYSVNQSNNYEIIIKSKNSSDYRNYSSLISFRIEPKYEEDKIHFRRMNEIVHYELILWSKNKISDITMLSDFEIVIEIRKNLQDKTLDNNETIEKRIPIISGLPYGNQSLNNKYEIILD